MSTNMKQHDMLRREWRNSQEKVQTILPQGFASQIPINGICLILWSQIIHYSVFDRLVYLTIDLCDHSRVSILWLNI